MGILRASPWKRGEENPEAEGERHPIGQRRTQVSTRSVGPTGREKRDTGHREQGGRGRSGKEGKTKRQQHKYRQGEGMKKGNREKSRA